jgi:hypothetical protein
MRATRLGAGRYPLHARPRRIQHMQKLVVGALGALALGVTFGLTRPAAAG